MIGEGRTDQEEALADGVAKGGDSEDTERVPAEIQDVSFPVALRGYDRRAVDDYVARVQTVIADLDASRSPEAAVRHALEQVAEQTGGILENAGETAEKIAVAARRQAEETTASAKSEAAEIVTRARKEAEDLLGRSKTEAETLLAEARTAADEERRRSEEEISAHQEEAEERMRQLRSEADSVRDERRQLLENVREIAARVEVAANEADERFRPQERGRARAKAVPDTPAEAVTESADAAEDAQEP